MPMLVFKYFLTAAIIVLVSELAKHNDRLGALIAALPMVSLMVLVWLYLGGQSNEKLSSHAWFTFWYVLPTLPMFALFPFFLERWTFWVSLMISALLTIFCFVLLAALVKRWGVDLW